MSLSIRPNSSCRFDLSRSGEVMLRLDHGRRAIATTRHFASGEGGGESTLRAASAVLRLDTAVVTALVDNPVAAWCRTSSIKGSRSSYLRWVADDGVGPWR